MFLPKKHLSRRTVLRGAGVTLALPLLDAMIPAATALAQTAASPKLRMGFFYIPHGAIMGNTSFGPEMDRWTPSGSGADFTLSPILKSLEPHKRYVTSLGNLQNQAMVGGVHSLAPATWLSGMRPDKASASASMSGTLDQVVAQHIGQNTTLPSLEVASETTQQAAACSGSACFYNTTLSFRDPHSPLPMEHNPRKVFIQLFGEGDTPEERAAISDQTKSLLDRVRDRIKRVAAGPGRGRSCGARQLRGDGARDRAAGAAGVEPRPVIRQRARGADRRAERVRLAGRSDVRSDRAGVPGGSDAGGVVHHGGRRAPIAPTTTSACRIPSIRSRITRTTRAGSRSSSKIQTWHMERFAAFLDKIAKIPDGDGTLLDHAMFLYGSNMSNSDRHNGHPLPTILVGGGNGTLRGGQHIAPAQPTPIANLHLTILEKIGAARSSFGDSTGTIAGL